MNKMQGVLLMDPSKANSIAKEFLAKQKTMDNVRNIKHLASSVFT
jgi:purine-nucleoside phosphorylase